MAYRMLTANFWQASQAKASQHEFQGRRAFGISRPAFSDSLSVVSHDIPTARAGFLKDLVKVLSVALGVSRVSGFGAATPCVFRALQCN